MLDSAASNAYPAQDRRRWPSHRQRRHRSSRKHAADTRGPRCHRCSKPSSRPLTTGLRARRPSRRWTRVIGPSVPQIARIRHRLSFDDRTCRLMFIPGRTNGSNRASGAMDFTASITNIAPRLAAEMLGSNSHRADHCAIWATAPRSRLCATEKAWTRPWVSRRSKA